MTAGVLSFKSFKLLTVLLS